MALIEKKRENHVCVPKPEDVQNDLLLSGLLDVRVLHGDEGGEDPFDLCEVQPTRLVLRKTSKFCYSGKIDMRTKWVWNIYLGLETLKYPGETKRP